jgi:mono/diheme cytochrome c family protein
MSSVRPDRFIALCALVCLLCLGATAYMTAQAAAAKTVASGVFTEAQAARGAMEYDTQCSGCHNPDLAGGSGPALKEQRFARDFAGKDLTALFTKISKTMPRNNPGTLDDEDALDLVAHILKENGFPAGAAELTSAGMEGVQLIAGKPKPPPPPGDFSYVETVGCLSAGPDNTWLLTRASDPITVNPIAATAAAPGAPAPESPKTLGTRTIHLLDAMAYTPEAHKGHKMLVRGLLVKLPDEQRMTISNFTMVAPTCSE